MFPPECFSLYPCLSYFFFLFLRSFYVSIISLRLCFVFSYYHLSSLLPVASVYLAEKHWSFKAFFFFLFFLFWCLLADSLLFLALQTSSNLFFLLSLKILRVDATTFKLQIFVIFLSSLCRDGSEQKQCKCCR